MSLTMMCGERLMYVCEMIVKVNDKEENEKGLDKELPELIDKKYEATGEDKKELMQKYFKEEINSDQAQIKSVILGQFAHKRTREEAGFDAFGNDYADKRVNWERKA
eukprot:TRINITY_DN1101_c0_g3_i1.p4 TRINITY_DN1101_c0_g3~~TRINITY_DN1101_c0_g3_i1.p4  ORF type:complete len:107 (-),score=35.82 TRINITY_DN1101_c0_g3_i1:643-963(-)